MRIGLDLGGTKIEIIALDDAGQPLLRQRIATPQGNYSASLDALVQLVRDCERALGQNGTVGIGIPGSESPLTGAIRNANSTCLNGKPLRADLEALLQREVRLANDANCFALSEATDGAAHGAKGVFGVILGTGVGGGLVIDGQIVSGHNGIAGEWGHNGLARMEPEDLPLRNCFCGRRSCIETYLSGPALAADHQALTGQTLSVETIVAEAAGGDAGCEHSLVRYERRLARALASIINVVDPDCIVLGGGLSNLSRLYRTVPELWAAEVFSDVISTRLLPPAHGDSSGVRGAAWLWPA